MAQKLGITATVYAPEGSPTAKIDAVRRFGAEVRMLPFEQWWKIIKGRGHARDSGLYIDAVRSPAALAGNGTIGLEILEDLPDVDSIVIPFGGGGVTCGIASFVSSAKPDTSIIVAESDASTPVTAALAAGKPVTVDMSPSFITGAGAPAVLEEMWPLVSTLVDGTVVATVSAVEDAVRHLFINNRVVAEGAGAISVAGAMTNNMGNGKIVCVVTGGNIDSDVMAKILQR
jgi:threonine dehydratase